MPTPLTAARRLRFALGLLVAVLAAGTIGYVLLGFGWVDAVYQTVMTVTTVGFREVEPFTTTGKVFTTGLILVGTGTAIYALGVLIEMLIEGQLRDLYGTRRMERNLADMSNHIVLCGWGRVGRAISRFVAGMGHEIVVIDRDEGRLADCPFAKVVGDATEDSVLERAGVARARTIVAALDSDASNLFVTVSARAMQPNVFIVARVRLDENHAKLVRAGADRVVNPQEIGGARMAAFVNQPHVAEFLDVVMHDGSLEFRLEEVMVPKGSAVAGSTLREAHLRDRTGALVLALRDSTGQFLTNPPPETVIDEGQVLIAIGTATQVRALVAEVAGR